MTQQLLIVNGRAGVIWRPEKFPVINEKPEKVRASITNVDGRPLALFYNGEALCKATEILALRAVHYREQQHGRLNLCLAIDYGTTEKKSLVDSQFMKSGDSVTASASAMFFQHSTAIFGGKYATLAELVSGSENGNMVIRKFTMDFANYGMGSGIAIMP